MDRLPSTSFGGSRPNDLTSMNTQRRSSSRSIRRKKFDDELVEYSARPADASAIAPIPGSSKTMRIRAHSVPSSSGEPMMNPVPSTSGHRKSGSRSRGKSRHSRHSVSAIKDLGRWKPTDDLALINAVIQTCDLRAVERGVKFSCRFTYQEISQRWHALLYDQVVSRVAMAAIQNLHPDLVAAIRAKALYSVAEEELLAAIPSTTDPKIDVFENLLALHPNVFYHSRTAKHLHGHWTLMRQYYLLKDQTFLEQDYHTFSDVEETMNDSLLTEPRDEALEQEILLADRRAKREIRTLEEELSRLQVVVEAVGGPGSVAWGANGMDTQTVAVLRGRSVRYLMRSSEVTIGRKTKTHTVDIDLTMEAHGPAMKVSRRQGTICMRGNGDFFICNEGKRPLFVDGKPVLTGHKQRLSHDSVLEISGFQFLFLINPAILEYVQIDALKPRMPP